MTNNGYSNLVGGGGWGVGGGQIRCLIENVEVAYAQQDSLFYSSQNEELG